MRAGPVLLAIVRHWAMIEPRLTAGEARRLRALAARAAACGKSPGRLDRAAAEIAALLAAALPAGHPAVRLIASDGGAGARELDVTALAGELRLLLAGQAGLAARPSGTAQRDRGWQSLSDRGGSLPPGRGEIRGRRAQGRARLAAEIELEAMARLALAPALSASRLRSLGGDPGQQYLIRLDGRNGTRFPLFQFDGDGRPLRLVMAINALLGADTDPWGVADWWLGRSAWLGRTPADAIGKTADDTLLALARAIAAAV